MVVATDHPAWATKARFSIPQALPALANLAAFAEVRQCLVRVVSETAVANPKEARELPRQSERSQRSRRQAFQTIRNMLDSDG